MARRVLVGVCLLLVLPCFFLACAGAGQKKYEAMFSFGDSVSDTGNICVNKSAAAQLLLTIAQPPYGMTYFGHPTCRCSDGRLVVDFLAQELGLPLLPPSKLHGTDFRKGANMAIVGGTALDFEFLKSIGLGYPIWNNGAMNVQIQWFRDLLPSICGSPQGHGCKVHLAKSLFVFGPFGGNDYNAMLFFGFTVDQARNYTPRIVDNIASGVEQLIELGAVDIVVPGALPVGCFAVYLTILPSTNPAEYDEFGCLKPLNDLSRYHNSLLQSRLAGLRARHRSARIMYADYYAQIELTVHRPPLFGFSSGAMTACCGAGGGKYNYEFEARCGMKGASACADPSTHESWDGIHLTEAVNRQTADGWLMGPYCHPPILQ
ncbi:GDSL esterase/lipase At5g45910-like [Phragmites australis]|uniref:GDSL esterase/lipase At5g45910-like n=1 Tax=Phragmites australis TaxID=29695 RepID=UPI002D77BF14|nr:GDSL esterase/lipase At5g45910-like [Phragmites australis]